MLSRLRQIMPASGTLLMGLLVSLVLAGCSEDDNGQPFLLCGNGIVDSGEQCDPCPSATPCMLNDNGPCLSTCVLARCGDGYVQTGVEECDSFNLAGSSCATFGRAEGPLVCDPQCRFDLTACGDAFTPTPTFTPTATPTLTETPTVTATPTETTTPAGTLTPTPTITDTPTPTQTATATFTPPPNCGDGNVDEGETCDDGNQNEGDTCPADCVINPCEPTEMRLSIVTSFSSSSGRRPSTISLLQSYPDGVVSIPGSANAATVRERITDGPQGATFVRNDLDYQVRVVLSRAPEIPVDQLFRISFDVCTGAPAPTLEDFPCVIERASDQNGTIAGVTCNAEIE